MESEVFFVGGVVRKVEVWEELEEPMENQWRWLELKEKFKVKRCFVFNDAGDFFPLLFPSHAIT